MTPTEMSVAEWKLAAVLLLFVTLFLFVVWN